MNLDNDKKRKIVLTYRILLMSLGWFTFILIAYNKLILNGIEISIFHSIFQSVKFYTIQTNILVVLWLTMSVLWFKSDRVNGEKFNFLHGAVVLYITVTFLVYALILDPLYTPPTPYEQFVDIVTHYIMPIAVIVDWSITGRNYQYKWKYLIYWMVYPICYLAFALIHGTMTGNYIYPFLNIVKLGIPVFIVCLIVLLGLYSMLISIYIGINRKSVSHGKIGNQ